MNNTIKNTIDSEGNRTASEDKHVIQLLRDRENAELETIRALEGFDFEACSPHTIELLNEIEEAIVAKAETLRQQCIALSNLHKYMRSCGMKNNEVEAKRLLQAIARRKDECIQMAFKLSYFPPATLELRNGAGLLD